MAESRFSFEFGGGLHSLQCRCSARAKADFGFDGQLLAAVTGP